MENKHSLLVYRIFRYRNAYNNKTPVWKKEIEFSLSILVFYRCYGLKQKTEQRASSTDLFTIKKETCHTTQWKTFCICIVFSTVDLNKIDFKVLYSKIDFQLSINLKDVSFKLMDNKYSLLKILTQPILTWFPLFFPNLCLGLLIHVIQIHVNC